MKTVVFFFFLFLGADLQAQNIAIPDANFKAFLVANYDQNMDGEISVAEAESVTGALNCSGQNIADLTGIGYFVNIAELDCCNNQLTALPPLPAGLIILNCLGNQLTALPPLPAGLIILNCSGNQLIAMPKLPAGMVILDCGDNQLAALPQLPAGLVSLACFQNQLTVLPSLPASLSTLNCRLNQLTALPRLPTGLSALKCSNNQLTAFPNVVNNPALDVLECEENFFTNRDCAAIQAFAARPNVSTFTFDLLKNGGDLLCFPDDNFTAFLLDAYDLNGDQAVSSLEVENETTLKCEGRNIHDLAGVDAFTSLTSLDCSHNQLAELPTLPMGLTTLDCSFNLLTALDFTNRPLLEEVDFSDNQLTAFPDFSVAGPRAARIKIVRGRNNNISAASLPVILPSIQRLDLSGNDLTALSPAFINSLTTATELGLANASLSHMPDMDGLTALNRIDLAGNQLTAVPVLPSSLEDLDLSDNSLLDANGAAGLTRLTALAVGGNQLVSLPDFRLLVDLDVLDIGGNPFASLQATLDQLPASIASLDLSALELEAVPDLSRFTELRALNLAANLFTAVPDLTPYSGLTAVDLSDTSLSGLDLTALPTGLTALRLAGLDLAAVPDLSPLPALAILDLSRNRLAILDPEPSLDLVEIDASDNDLAQLFIDSFANLEALRLNRNQLAALPNLSSFPDLRVLEVGENFLTAVNGLAGLTQVERLVISNNALTELAPHVPFETLSPSIPGTQVMKTLSCQGNNFTLDDCSTASTLETAGVQFFTLNPQNNGMGLTCADVTLYHPGLPLWSAANGPRFCGALNPDIRNFIQFINNGFSCP